MARHRSPSGAHADALRRPARALDAPRPVPARQGTPAYPLRPPVAPRRAVGAPVAGVVPPPAPPHGRRPLAPLDQSTFVGHGGHAPVRRPAYSDGTAFAPLPIAPPARRHTHRATPDTTPAPPAGPAPHARVLPSAQTSLRGKATVAAVAAGAVVAAGQTLVAPLSERPAPVTVAAMIPVAEAGPTQEAATSSAAPVGAIGGDQLLPDPRAVGRGRGTPDPGTEVDVQNLVKAVDIGKEISRKNAIIDAAKSFGAAEAHLVGDEAYVKPTTGVFTSGFGGRWGTTHYGLDIAAPIGTPIYALTDAVVVESGPASGFGLWVVLRHTDGTFSVYGHINRTFVEVGQKVSAGEQIAEIGNRGFSTGPHLHLEIWTADKTKINPAPWLAERGISF